MFTEWEIALLSLQAPGTLLSRQHALRLHFLLGQNIKNLDRPKSGGKPFSTLRTPNARFSVHFSF